MDHSRNFGSMLLERQLKKTVNRFRQQGEPGSLASNTRNAADTVSSMVGSNAKSRSKRFFFSALSTVATLLIAAAPMHAVADDTEVFFGRIDQSQQIKPNVLFALDTSGSMSWGSDDPGATEPRITRLKGALVNILQGASNLNIGLMRFNGSYGGGSIIYPVEDIDKPVCSGGQCEVVPLINRIGELDNDAEENLDDNSVTLSNETIWLGSPAGESYDQRTALRFEGINVPSGASIVSATLEFEAGVNASVSSSYQIGIENVDSSAEITDADGDLSGRTISSTTKPWFPGTWTKDSIYQTPDLSELIQQVVNRPGWCGGNALTLFIDGSGERGAKTSDHDANRAPALHLSYDSATIPANGGCTQKRVIASVKQKNDDAEQSTSNHATHLNYGNMTLTKRGRWQRLIGLRFQDLGIPKGSTITAANIEFEIDRYRSGPVSLKIAGEAADSTEPFVSRQFNISNRPKTATSVNWVNPPELSTNEKLQTPDLAPIVQEIVDRGGWNSGNSMVFMIEYLSGSGRRIVETFDGEPANAPRLTIDYISSGDNRLTVRDLLIEQVEGLRVGGGTPILDVLYEGARYLRGENVQYGKSRGRYFNYWWDFRLPYNRVSHPESYTGGSVYVHSNCTASNYEHPDCKTEQIVGSPTYISPMNSSCQSNHLILLSDGQPSATSAFNDVKSMIGNNNCSGSRDEHCINELVSWMQETDHSTGLSGVQNISTYTIGFGKPAELVFLEGISEAGGGQYFEAVTAEDLQQAFGRILSDVLDVETTFVAPGATVNQFNRLTHRNDIYFSLFRPLDVPKWDGNLKKYKLKTHPDDSVEIVDFNDNPAVDNDTGFFSSDAKSFWSDVVDGSEVFRGGAAAELALSTPTYGSRKVYTYTGSGLPDNELLSSAENQLHENNTFLTKGLLGIPSESNAYRTSLVKWARGVDVNDSNNDDNYNDIRKSMGDPMHSRPLIVNYNSGSTEIDSTIYVATNEGYLHAIDHASGEEVFSFVPQELLPNLNEFYDNDPTARHPYGLDGQLSLYLDDSNGNTVIDSGETAILYLGMRRGGNNYYAIDISNRSAPRLLWTIKGGASGTIEFEEMGQSWSMASVAYIKYGSSDHHPVLIFGAGYDPNQDDDPTQPTAPRRFDSIGRGIFIVDAITGERIWSVSPSSTGSKHTIMSDMNYSIPSDIRILDVDLDGNADQLYFGDMGGQIWRMDFDYANPGGQLLVGGKVADLAGSAPKDARRFFYEPDLALVSRAGKRFLGLSIGSGWRAHPLDETVEDRFYMLRLPLTYGKPEGYGKVDTSSGTTSWSPITESDLLDISDTTHPLESDVLAHDGWLLEMPNEGEKVLGESLTIDSRVIFTSYQPDLDIGICDTAAGGGNIYAVDIFDGSPVIDFDENSNGNSNNFTESDRSKSLQHGGIPPEPSALITEEGVPVVAAGTQLIDAIEFGSLTERTWWQEASSD